MLTGGFWATQVNEPAHNIARIETRIRVRIIQDQPLNSDWMPRLTLESTNILARSVRKWGQKRKRRDSPIMLQFNGLLQRLDVTGQERSGTSETRDRLQDPDLP
jgi:hypothetical protein